VTRVFFDVAVSLDGLMAGPNASPANPIGDGGQDLHEWMFATASFHGGQAGETGPDNDVVQATNDRTGVTILGKRMFDEGIANWGAEPPFHTDVFVLTHEAREPWAWPGGTTYYYVNDGPEAALLRAHESAGSKDIRIGGGAETIQQYLDLGLIDDFTLHFAPITLGQGHPLFRPGSPRRDFRIVETIPTARCTHVRYEAMR